MLSFHWSELGHASSHFGREWGELDGGRPAPWTPVGSGRERDILKKKPGPQGGLNGSPKQQLSTARE